MYTKCSIYVKKRWKYAVNPDIFTFQLFRLNAYQTCHLEHLCQADSVCLTCTQKFLCHCDIPEHLYTLYDYIYCRRWIWIWAPPVKHSVLKCPRAKHWPLSVWLLPRTSQGNLKWCLCQQLLNEWMWQTKTLLWIGMIFMR